jgi:hypothetical protein
MNEPDLHEVDHLQRATRHLVLKHKILRQKRVWRRDFALKMLVQVLQYSIFGLLRVSHSARVVARSLILL